jgi:hypothetical protein
LGRWDAAGEPKPLSQLGKATAEESVPVESHDPVPPAQEKADLPSPAARESKEKVGDSMPVRPRINRSG